MAITIRPRRKSDLNNLCQTLTYVHKEDGYPVEGVASPLEWLTPIGLIGAWTALLKEKPIGNCIVASASTDTSVANHAKRAIQCELDKIVILERLFVSPAARGLHAGYKLIQNSMNWAAERELCLALEVLDKDSKAASIYKTLGFSQVASTLHTYDGGYEPSAVLVWNPKL